MKKTLCIFLFITSLLSAKSSMTPYLTSESDTLALVDRVINAYNGKLVQIDPDIEIQGSDSLELIRYYDGGQQHFNCEFGYGMGMSLPTQIEFDPYNDKKNMLIEQRMGLTLPFSVKGLKAKKKHKEKTYAGVVDPQCFELGYTNCCEALLRGESSVCAMKVSGTENNFVVTLGDGTKRHYDYFGSKDGFRYFRLTLEERANGNRRHFSYIQNNSIWLSRVCTNNQGDSTTLNWINFTYGPDHQVIATASNGQNVQYQTTLKKGKAKQKNGRSYKETKFYEWLLTQVSGAHLPTTNFEHLDRTRFTDTIFSVKRITKPDGRSLAVEFGHDERVKSLFASGVNIPLYTFDYHLHHTNVQNALGAVQRFDFSKRRLIKLSEGYRIQNFSWDSKGQLISHEMTEPSGHIINKRKYFYDNLGNIVESQIHGRITSSTSQDCFVLRHTYAKDGRNLTLTENHNCEREFSFAYLPNTNLMTRKLTFADQHFAEREFRGYDQNGILISIIVDDGSIYQMNDLTNVTYRHITEIEPQLNPNLPGMTLPRVIKEWYVDPKTGQQHLLKMVERTYAQGDLLAEEKVYDAHSNYRYSLLFEYNNQRKLIHKVNALGEATIYAYDANLNKTYEETIGSGKKVRYFYDTANRLIEEREEHGNGNVLKATHTYDVMGNRISTTDHFGQITTFTYDIYSREISQTDPLGNTEHKEYDTQGNIISVVDKEGFTTKTIYNFYGDPLKIQYPDGTSKRFTYNLQGHLIQEWERDEITTTYQVDYKGRSRVSNTYATDGSLLKTLQFVYKGPNLIAEIDAMGNRTDYLYDGAGRKTTKIQGDLETHYEYDPLGRLSKTITADRVEIAEYDLLDRVVEERIEDLSGNIFSKIQHTYDIHGNCTTQKEYSDSQNFAETIILYNSENLPIAEVDALGNKTSITYYYTDHLEKETIDPLDRKQLEIYDKLNRVTAIHKYSSNGQLLSHSSFAYDGRGNKILQHERSLFQDQSFGIYAISTTYDGMSQKISETEQNERTTTYIYKNGRLHTITKPDSVVLTHNYDPLGHLQELISSDGTIHYRYTYDLNDNLLKANDLIHNLTTERSYDTLNRLVFEKQATGFEFHYEYDTLSRLKEFNFLDGKITYFYSPISLISASRYNDNELLYTFTQQTDLRGKVIDATLPNGVNISYNWDDMGRCAEIKSTPFHQSFSYDSLGNLIATSVQDPLGTYEGTFTYDELNQITQETGPFANQYTFDSLHNRRNKNGATCSIDGFNQLTSDSIDNYTYDKNGRRTAKNNAQYTYDALGRLTAFNDGQQRIDYRYDPFGRRIERRDSNTVVQYWYQFDTEIGAYANDNLREFRAIHGQFAPFALELDGSIYSPMRNHRGDICVLLDDQQAPITTYRYDAFGEFSFQGLEDSPWLFSGQRYDNETHLYHFSKREYDPVQGRWLTPDPLGFADGPNLYAYVHNNPLTYVDPYGLYREQVRNFTIGLSRGFIDDMTWNASSKFLGNYETRTWSSKIGYGFGVGTSIAVGLCYGTVEARLLKGAYSAFKGMRAATPLVRVGKSLSETSKVVKLAQEGSSTAQKISHAAQRSVVLEQEATKLNRFHLAASELSDNGKNNIRILRGWAKSKGWKMKTNLQGGPEIWGYKDVNGRVKWNLKIKPLGSVREGIQPGSQVPRFSSRFNDGNYVNPFTGKIGGTDVGGHIPLE